MAKTLAQGRKPGSGRKPGKGKTLREGRKPGSGRRRRNEEAVVTVVIEPSSLNTNTLAQEKKSLSICSGMSPALRAAAVDKDVEKKNSISSRDLEAIDALRELNNSPPQQQPLTPTPTPTHLQSQLKSQYQSAYHPTSTQQRQQQVENLPSRQFLTNIQVHSNPSVTPTIASGNRISFTSMNPYTISPPYMHAPLVPFKGQSLMVQPQSINGLMNTEFNTSILPVVRTSATPTINHNSNTNSSIRNNDNTNHQDTAGNLLIQTKT